MPTLQLLPPQTVDDLRLRLDGNRTKLAALFGMLDRFSLSTPVVDAAPLPDA